MPGAVEENMIILLLLIVIALLLYLLFWPVPIKPISWNAPALPAAKGDYAANDLLAAAQRLPAGGSGPEDVIVDSQSRVYTGLADGRIMRMNSDGSNLEKFAKTNGRPLGLAFDAVGNLLIADADQGLLSVNPQGELQVLVNQVDGRKLKFTNHLAVAAAGTIYFTESSDRFPLGDMVSEILESRPNGRLFAYDPQSGETKLVIDDLYCANGVAIHHEQNFLLVSETTRYRLRRIWLSGAHAGQDDSFIDNLPGLPDNLHYNGYDTFWLTLILPRIPIVDKLAGFPFLRKLIYRLPSAVKPKPEQYGYVLGLDAGGNIIHNIQDPSGIIAQTSGAVEHNGELYIGSFSENFIARLPIQDM